MILELENVTSGYGDTTVLWDVNMAVDEGEIVGIIGRNGVGKTTLMKTIIGLLVVRSGTIRFKDEDVTEQSANQRARFGMGYIPQGREIFADLTVEKNLQMGELINYDQDEFLEDLVYEYFPRLDERRKQKAGTMSGGEQQMLAIARALVANPDILLLDEPSEGIQPSIVKQIQKNVLDINEELGTTILFVEQNLEFVQSVAQRCYIVDNGKIVNEMEREQLKKDDELAKYLSV